MPSPDTITLLNRVLAILERSFPQYMLFARPYVPPGREIVMQTIEQIVAGQNALAERVTEQVLDSGGRPDHGDFSIDFTDMHDLGIDFLLQEAIDCVKQDVADLQECADALRPTPTAQSLAGEALGLTKGHLEILQKVTATAAASPNTDAPPAAANGAPASKEPASAPQA